MKNQYKLRIILRNNFEVRGNFYSKKEADDFMLNILDGYEEEDFIQVEHDDKRRELQIFRKKDIILMEVINNEFHED